ncbi:hypothetical protein L6R52_40660, partial [Myxococcota bacterium]|nr:hypothetical protein [Myxococcota bacterium]
LLDADLALVLDASPSAAALDARLFDPTSEAVTGGARMKEVTVVALEPGPGGAPVLSAVARRVGHAWWDGLDASEHLAVDLSSLAETPPAPHAAAHGLTLRGVGADRLARDPTWTCLLDAAIDRAPLLPQEWSGARAVGGDLIGWTGGPQDSVSWLARVTRLRAPGHDGEGLELTLPDVYTKAHMLAAGARHVHTLVSRGDAGARSLDIAFDVLPRSVLVAFDAFARHVEARGARGAADVTPELWASFEAEHGGLVRRIGQRLARGVGQHYLEKQRARRGESTAAFFSALAHHDRRVEGLFKVVSRTRALVGEEMTRAISQPSGMVSNTASSRGVAARCDDDRPRLRAFYTAASDAYRPARAEELRDVWAGELGIGERPGVGHVLTLRLLPDQVWPQIEAAIDGLGLPPRDRDASRAALARWAEAKTRDPAALVSDLERSGLAPLAPVIARAVTAAVEARITGQLRRTELAVVFVLGALERR